MQPNDIERGRRCDPRRTSDSSSRRTTTPTATRRLAARAAPRAAAAGQGLGDGARRNRAVAGRVRLPRLEDHGLVREAPADVSERVLVAVDCAQENRIVEPDAPRRRVSGRSTSTTTTTTRASVTSTSSSTTRRPPAEVLADVFRELGVTLDADDRRGAVHRPGDRHGALPVLEHDRQGAAARRRPRRGGRGRDEGLPGRLRVDPVRQAQAARAGTRDARSSSRAA